MFGFVQNIDYNGDFIQEHMNILRQEKKKKETKVNSRYTFLSASIFALQDYEQGIAAKGSKESILGAERMLFLMWGPVSRPAQPLVHVAGMHQPYLCRP